MAFRERLELVVDVVTGGSTSSGLGKLKTDLGEADGAFEKLKVAGGGAFDFVKQNAASFAVAAGAALTGFAVKAVGEFQETALGAGQLRDSLGITADEASRFQEVAGDLGIGVGTLEGAIGRMNRTAATTPEAFAEIGAELARNKDGTVNVTDTFINVVGALNKIEDPTKRAAAAQKILGRSWQEASELIAMGADGVRDAMAGVEDGKIIDDKEIARAREFRDTLDNLKGVVEEFTIQVGGALVPALTDAAESMQDFAGPTADVLSKIQEFKESDFGSAFFTAVNPIDGARDALDKFGQGIDEITGKSGEMEVSYNAAASEAAWLAKQQEGVRSVTDDLTGIIGGAVGGLEDLGEEYESTAVSAANLADGSLILADDALAALDEWMDVVENSAGEMADALDKAFGSTLDLQEGADETRQKLEDLSSSLKDNGKTLDENTEKGRENRAALRDAAKQVQDYTGQLIQSGASTDEVNGKYQYMRQELINRVMPAFGGSEQAAADYINQLGLTPDSVNTAVVLENKQRAQDMLRDYLGTVESVPASKLSYMQVLTEQGEVDALRRAIDGLPSTKVSTIYVNTVQTGSTSNMGKRVLAGGGTVYDAAAAGGRTTWELGGATTLVGENGPELVRLPQGAHVYRNGETRELLSGGGAGGVVFAPQVTVNAGLGTDPRALQRAVMDALAGVVRDNGPAALRRMLGVPTVGNVA